MVPCTARANPRDRCIDAIVLVPGTQVLRRTSGTYSRAVGWDSNIPIRVIGDGKFEMNCRALDLRAHLFLKEKIPSPKKHSGQLVYPRLNHTCEAAPVEGVGRPSSKHPKTVEGRTLLDEDRHIQHFNVLVSQNCQPRQA